MSDGSIVAAQNPQTLADVLKPIPASMIGAAIPFHESQLYLLRGPSPLTLLPMLRGSPGDRQAYVIDAANSM